MTAPVAPVLDRLKRIIASVGVAMVPMMALPLLAAATMVTVAAATGADLGQAFTDAPRVPLDIGAVVGWEDDAGPLLRSVEPDTRDDVAAAWVGALESVDSALVGETTAMETWFTGGALTRVQAHNDAGSVVLGPEWLDHRVQVWFYSLDGRILGVTVDSQGSLDVDGTAIDVADEYTVVLMLQDGYWRIAALDVRRPS